MTDISKAAVIGAGVIGRSWTAIFHRAGVDVRIADIDMDRAHTARDWAEQLNEGKAGCGSITICESIEAASQGADWVQENVADNLALKQSVFRTAASAACDDAILASSGSTIEPDVLNKDIPNPGRVIIAHPFNPPHIMPVVELVPGNATKTDIMDRAASMMEAVGQSPIRLKRYIPSLIFNRLQGALMREAFDLYTSGAADIADIDRCIADGLALRATVLGSFGVNHTNADGGIGEYFTKFDDWADEMEALSAKAPRFTPEFVEKLALDMREATAHTTHSDMVRMRDAQMQRIIEIKRSYK
ncbi:MAG: 3-hydroxyacyl-CoA dehydrogenase NAD-binding domain-containing protein [Sphingorhabdus sp.]